MSIQEVRLGHPSSAIMGGEEGLVLPSGPASARGIIPKVGQVRGNTDTGQLEMYLAGEWRTYDPAKSVVAEAIFTKTVPTNSIVPANTSGGSFTINLPVNSSIGDTVTIFDSGDSFDDNNLTINPGAENIDNVPGPIVIKKRGAYKHFLFLGIGSGWLDTGAKGSVRSVLLSNTSYPVQLATNTSYFSSLGGIATLDLTLPENPEAGDVITFDGIEDDLNFRGKPVTIRLAASGERINGVAGVHTVRDITNSFRLVYTGDSNPGWLVKGIIPDAIKQFPFVTSTGNFNSYIVEGRHPISGSRGSFTNVPNFPYATITGTLDVSSSNGTVLQELTAYFNDGTSSTRVVKYVRAGILNGSIATGWSEWNETLMGKPGNNVTLVSHGRIDARTEGSAFYVNPASGTPDHAGGDDYLVETKNNRSADPFNTGDTAEKLVYATNWRTKQVWVGTADGINNQQVTDWRKEGNLIETISGVGTRSVRPSASETYILCESTGDQQVNLLLPDNIGEKLGHREGDMITIRNLNENVGITNIVSEIDVISVNGHNIGKGPHLMEGPAHITFVLRKASSTDNFELKVVDDSREPVRALTPVTLSSSSYPYNTEVNSRYFMSLAIAGTISFTLPSNPEPGDYMEFWGTEEALRFTNKHVTLNRAASGERINGDAANLNIETAANSFKLIYSGSANPGWLLRDVHKDAIDMHFNVLGFGDFDAFFQEGRHRLNGASSGFSNRPDVPYGKIVGTLDVTTIDSRILQEISVFDDQQPSTQVIKYMRSGTFNGISAYNFNDWNMCLTGRPGSYEVLNNQGRLDIEREGIIYYVSPLTGTPDHLPGDDYLVETKSKFSADRFHNSIISEKLIYATNWRTKQLWIGSSDSLSPGLVNSWRKEGVFIKECYGGGTFSTTTYAPKTMVLCQSTGNQTVVLLIPDEIEDNEGCREGDIISIRNINEDIGVTTISAGVDFIDTEGTNIGPGPHTMTGPGALELMLETVGNSNAFQLKILIGVKA